jgi:hypothetical protein
VASFLQIFLTKIPYTPVLSPIRSTCPAYVILDSVTRTLFGEAYRSLSSSLCIFLYSPVTLSLVGPNILLNTLFSNTLSLRFSLNVSDRVSHPYKTYWRCAYIYWLLLAILNVRKSFLQNLHSPQGFIWLLCHPVLGNFRSPESVDTWLFGLKSLKWLNNFQVRHPSRVFQSNE